MASGIQYGVSKRGKQTLISHNFEYWQHKVNNQGHVIWKCSKYQVFKCKASVKTAEDAFVGNDSPDHNHSGNVASALARTAIGRMKTIMEENIATPSASQAAVVGQLDGHVQIALPKRASLSRVLRRHRQIQNMKAGGSQALPTIPSDVNFAIPSRFQQFLLYDSGPGSDRLLIFGERHLLQGLERAKQWLADGTFKVVPSLFYQLYTIHFESHGGHNPTGIYCLLVNKTRNTYDRMLSALKQLIPSAAPERVLVDFESAAMGAFHDAYPEAQIRGCYFHLCQSINRKVNEVGLKQEYETDNEVRGFLRCLTAISHVPEDDVVMAFEMLVSEMPANEKVNDVVTYFEHTYVRGRRRPGRAANYGQAIFPIALWNQFDAAGEGIARTTNSVEGWHYSLQSLFMCQHPTMWTFLAGIERDSQMSKTAYLQAATGVQHVTEKKYRDLKARVTRAVTGYLDVDTMTYLRAIAHLSHT